MADPHDPNPLPSDAESSPPSPPAPTPPSSSGADDEGSEATTLVDETATPEIRTYSMWIHVGTLIATVVLMSLGGLPFFLPLAVALIMWLARKADHSFIDDHGREATNFQISLVILYLVTGVITLITCGVGVILTFALSVVAIIGLILAAIAANKGQIYRYPVCIRLIGPPTGKPTDGAPDA
ncbi:MAG: DUF4870 domain-containing protein [Planctomycetota bacterium]